jgi:hypothetical protein
VAEFQQREKKVYFPFQVLIFNAFSLSPFYIGLACLAHIHASATEEKNIFCIKKILHAVISWYILRQRIYSIGVHGNFGWVGAFDVFAVLLSLSLCFKLADTIEAKTLINAQASKRFAVLIQVSLGSMEKRE